jgi:TrmH family RNA methyltransferase
LRGRSPRRLFGRRRQAAPQHRLITSADNEQLKLVRKLHDRRWRDKLGLFVAEGEDLVAAARAGGHEELNLLVAGETVEPALLAGVSTLGHPPRVIGVFRKRDRVPLEHGATLMLWRVADPVNVGVLARSAGAFGAGLGLSRGCADPYAPKALRASMGSSLTVPLVEFGTAPGSVALVAHGGHPFDELDLGVYTTFVLGAEREGLPDEVVERCDVAATIRTPGRAESLNVAMAGTIALYEASRRSP